jgi:hypothetical protein
MGIVIGADRADKAGAGGVGGLQRHLRLAENA